MIDDCSNIFGVRRFGTPVTIAAQGSFYVGGHIVRAAGTFDECDQPIPGGAGQSHWVDQMYVGYQVPQRPRRLPIVLVHGGGGTGAVWESTPDGREGFHTLLLRRRYAVFAVDAPRGGRSGFPGFNGPLGCLDEGRQLVADRVVRTGREHAWSRWRLGPRYPEAFPEQSFPDGDAEMFLKHVRPIVADNAEVAADALVALFARIGPGILVTHSNSGLWGWLAAIRSERIKAIVSYEPGFVYPESAVPPAVALARGSEPAGVAVTDSEFDRLSRIPIEIVYGDNIPTGPVAELPADRRRAQIIHAHTFVRELAARNGRASLLSLPDIGVNGNSHFMFLDRNNHEVADSLEEFFGRNHLDT